MITLQEAAEIAVRTLTSQGFPFPDSEHPDHECPCEICTAVSLLQHVLVIEMAAQKVKTLKAKIEEIEHSKNNTQ